MELTAKELDALAPGSYTLLDLRDARSREYGGIPGAVAADADELLANPPQGEERLVLYCARGEISLETAEALREQGVDAFVSLVQKYTSSETADGLTENVTPGSVSDAYQEWAFNTGRQAGDVAVVETSSGYSVLFFDGYGDTYRNVLVENALRSTAYNEWYSSVTDGAAYTENSYGMRFVSK